MADSFAIVDLRDGIRRDVESFLVNNDSFPTLENSYLFRGRIERRSCFTAVGTDGRLKWSLGNTGASPFATTLLDGTFTGGIPAGVASFRIGSVVLTDPGGASPVTLISTDPAYSGTLNRTSGALSIAHPVIAPTPVIYVPGLPVLGLRVREVTALNDELLIAFDQRWSYQFDVGTNDFVAANTFAGTANQFIWTGQNYEQFWSTNYFKAFWATNNNAGFHAAQNASPVVERDGIRWFGVVGAATGWRNFNPRLDSGSATFLLGGLIVLPYKNRLVVLNSLEGVNLAGSVRFSQRARWSQNGTPFYGDFPDGASAVVSAWDSGANDIGKGGFLDAPTAESIVSAEFIKDTLVVYFERSTWQLVYTNNETLPFIWQKINTELGCESTFSIVPFDRGAFGIGNYGIITTDSVNVVRLDQKIPDEVFQIQNVNDGVKRVSGIRDYNAQLVYWSFPIRSDQDGDVVNYDLTYPNQVLVFNYLDGSWAEFDDCFTCFGTWQKFSDVTWAQLPVTWQSRQVAWNSAVLQGRYPDVIAGNQRGYVLVFSQLQLNGQNVPSIPISNITTATRTIYAPDHNFTNDQYVLITGVQGVTGINGIIYKVTQATTTTFVIDGTNTISGTYTGGGSLTHIPNIFIRTKEFNPYYQNGKSLRLNAVDLYMDRTTDGEITVQHFTSDNTSLPIDTDVISTAPEPMPTYSGVSPNYEEQQNKIWHRVYTDSYGSFVQNIFTLDDTQIRDLNIATSDITIHGLIYYVSPCGRVSYDL